MAERASLVSKLADDMLDLGTAADKVVQSFDAWDAGEDVSPFAWDRLREHVSGLRRELKRLGLP